MKNKRVIVALSGGVDSSVSAWLLKEQGFDVQGLFMKNWEREDYNVPCTATQDLEDVRSVCERLDIPLHTANFSQEYWELVFQNFLQEYASNRTPNPDILCNRFIKFGAFLEHAKQLGADYIATGHYASHHIEHDTHSLKVAKDANKDQTYFLYTLDQTQLAKTLFPLESFKKSEVRFIAKNLGLLNANKKDSVGICFIGERNFKPFLKRYIKPQPGLIKTEAQQKIGEHEGVMYYTLGQRKGLHVGGQKGFDEKPWYVYAKDPDTSTLFVTQNKIHPLLYTQTVFCHAINWISGTQPKMPYICQAKIRYRQPAILCTVTQEDQGRYCIKFDEPQWAVTSGQSIVLYDSAVCLGGGIVEVIQQQGP